MKFNEYRKYRWFFTHSRKLVIGGKNASQNDELLSYIKSLDKQLLVMHTLLPGSPFTVIFSDISSLSKSDLEECATFTASFSQLWKSKAKKALVESFYSSDLNKSKDMKQGTWGVSKRYKEFKVDLKLVLTVQEGVLRAVPQKSTSNKEILLKLSPGNSDKTSLSESILSQLGNRFKSSDILSALPAGGIKISK